MLEPKRWIRVEISMSPKPSNLSSEKIGTENDLYRAGLIPSYREHQSQNPIEMACTHELF